MILILSENDEPNTAAVINELTDLETPWFRFNGEEFPTNIKLHLSKDRTESFLCDVSGKNKHSKVYLKDISAVWFRRAGQFTPVKSLKDRASRAFCFYESLAAYEGLSEQLQDARWMNDLWNEKSADNTLYQLRKALDVGLNVPDYIITQDEVASEKFFNKHEGNVITKILHNSNPAQHSLNMIYTNTVKDSFEENKKFIQWCPTLFQEKVEREVELRITVVGNTVFPAVFIPQKTEFDVDIRVSNLRELSYCPFQLPNEINDAILKLMKELGLSFGTIDMIIDKSGRYVFLELNIGGQWGWIEGFTGFEISKEIAKWLAKGE